jgi:hypothetical protein
MLWSLEWIKTMASDQITAILQFGVAKRFSNRYLPRKRGKTFKEGKEEVRITWLITTLAVLKECLPYLLVIQMKDGDHK